jgi:hypothetical protein
MQFIANAWLAVVELPTVRSSTNYAATPFRSSK